MSLIPNQTFALDYDETFNADPELWMHIADMMKGRGHTVIGVTLRNRAEIVEDPRYLLCCKRVIYCAGHAKRPLLESMGIDISVWLDDKPMYIERTWADINNKSFVFPNGEEPELLLLEPFIMENTNY